MSRTDKIPALLVGVTGNKEINSLKKIYVFSEGDKGYEEVKQGNGMELAGAVFCFRWGVVREGLWVEVMRMFGQRPD